ncbi:hypothetical protein ACFYS8_16380 [Kitasatospora sp. NPDC004615]
MRIGHAAHALAAGTGIQLTRGGSQRLHLVTVPSGPGQPSTANS